jgi:predicted nucleotidyltransferase component of viral defense system
MAENAIRLISENRLRYISGLKRLNLIYIEKDYFLTALLYLLRDVRGLCFKGGTALNKIFLDHTRLSEDLDFAFRGKASEIEPVIIRILESGRGFFPEYRFENRTQDFFRLKIGYRGFFSRTSPVILDVNSKASVAIEPKSLGVPHFYSEIPDFRILTLDIRELAAEKVRTLIMRSQPRDYFDVYMLLEKGHKIDMELVKRKMMEAGQDFDIERIFRTAQKVYSRWDDMEQLTNKHVDFFGVIKRLQKEFGYKS